LEANNENTQIDHWASPSTALMLERPLVRRFSALSSKALNGGDPESDHRVLSGRDSEWNCLSRPRPTGRWQSSLKKKGTGFQHVAFRVENIEAALKELKEKALSSSTSSRDRCGRAKIASCTQSNRRRPGRTLRT